MIRRILAAALIALLPSLALAAPTTTMPSYTARGFTNDGSTGTTLNKLVKVISSGNAVIVATTDTYGAVGVAYAGAGTSGTVQVVSQGVVSCAFDGTATAGHFVGISSSTAGDCRDAGTSPPVGNQLIGVVTAGGSGAGTYTVILQLRSTAQSACGDLSNGAAGCSMSTTAGGDLSGTLPSPTVAKVNGVAYGASPSTDTVPTVTAANTVNYKSVPNCSNALTYDTGAHSWGCNVSAGTGTVTSVATSGCIVGGTITSTGTISSNCTTTPQGRLTLVTATPVMTTTTSGATTIYYTPHIGNLVPIYDGTNMVPTAFSELSQTTTDTTHNPAAVGASEVEDWFVWNDSGTLRLVHGPAWTSDTARCATCGLTRVNGIYLNTSAITNACGAQRCTWVGTTRSDASSQLDWIFGGNAAGGTAGFFGVWNAYNRVNVTTTVTNSTNTWTYGSAAWRSADNSNAMRVSFITGAQEGGFMAIYSGICNSTTTTSCAFGVGYNSTSAFTGTTGVITIATTSASQVSAPAVAAAQPFGFNYFQALEYASAGTVTFSGDAGAAYIQTGLTVMLRM